MPGFILGRGPLARNGGLLSRVPPEVLALGGVGPSEGLALRNLRRPISSSLAWSRLEALWFAWLAKGNLGAAMPESSGMRPALESSRLRRGLIGGRGGGAPPRLLERDLDSGYGRPLSFPSGPIARWWGRLTVGTRVVADMSVGSEISRLSTIRFAFTGPKAGD